MTLESLAPKKEMRPDKWETEIDNSKLALG